MSPLFLIGLKTFLLAAVVVVCLLAVEEAPPPSKNWVWVPGVLALLSAVGGTAIMVLSL